MPEYEKRVRKYSLKTAVPLSGTEKVTMIFGLAQLHAAM